MQHLCVGCLRQLRRLVPRHYADVLLLMRRPKRQLVDLQAAGAQGAAVGSKPPGGKGPAAPQAGMPGRQPALSQEGLATTPVPSTPATHTPFTPTTHALPAQRSRRRRRTSMRCWKPLYSMLASNASRLAGASSKACTRWPRAAAASEKKPYPAPTSTCGQHWRCPCRSVWGPQHTAALALARPGWRSLAPAAPESAGGRPGEGMNRGPSHQHRILGHAQRAHQRVGQRGPPRGLHRWLPAAVRGERGRDVPA